MFKLIILFIFTPIYLMANDNLSEYMDNISKLLNEKHYVPLEFSKNILSSLNIDNKTIEKITAPKEALSWGKYKNIFLTEVRLKNALIFMEEHYPLLDQVEKEFQVDKTIIVSLIGIESNFGKYKPVHNVGDALFTLAKYYPPRSKFFTSELIKYVLLRYLDKTYDDNSIKGSYAGAIGLPQFMPSSILNFGVDYDNDCKIDLISNWKDVFASVANYLKLNGWQYKELIAEHIKDKDKESLKNISASQLKIDLLANLGYSIPPSNKFSIKEFVNDNGTEPWLTYKNYDVIKTYNRSDNYALVAYFIKKYLDDNMVKKE